MKIVHASGWYENDAYAFDMIGIECNVATNIWIVYKLTGHLYPHEHIQDS